MILFVSKTRVPVLHAGFDECDGSDATDGLQTHQLRQSEDDDDAPHRPPIQRGLSSPLLPVSTSPEHIVVHCFFIILTSVSNSFICLFVFFLWTGRGSVL